MATVSVYKLMCLLFCVSDLVNTTIIESKNLDLIPNFDGKEHVEQGRTLVHHAVKRLMIILPAIFFKLGIAFTLLLVTVIGVINNSFIGFLLLVVGLSSVLARLQETRKSALSIPYLSPLPPYHHSVWDRNDVNSIERNEGTKTGYYSSYDSIDNQNSQFSPGLKYYSKYSTRAKV